MIIYEFTTWVGLEKRKYIIKEIEVEEKNKIFAGNHTRIRKDDIDKLDTHFGHRMYRLDKNPQPYISAITEYFKRRVEEYNTRLKEAKQELAEWEALKERDE